MTLWLVGVAGVLLAIACAYVASLLLLRALHRRREIGVRLALGISRGRLAALLFAESAVLPGMIDESTGIDWQTLALSGGVVVLTALLTGLAPVLQTVKSDATAGLRDGAQYGVTRRSRV